MTTRTQLLQAVRELHTWTRGSERAIHKPLLLLLALGRIARAEPRLMPFLEIETRLRNLIEQYGPTRRSYHPEYPFWRLRSDGIWEVPGGELLEKRQGNTNPTLTALRNSEGGFTVEVDRLLRTDAVLRDEIAGLILEAHFSATLHEDILEDVGLELGSRVAEPRARSRSPDFRQKVLLAYAYRCAVCTYSPQLDGRAIGLDAAHVWSFRQNGPDDVANGLALCPSHHKALDLGWISLDDSLRVIVTRRLHGGEEVEMQVGRFHGRTLSGPVRGEPSIALRNAAWHRNQVFKAPARE